MSRRTRFVLRGLRAGACLVVVLTAAALPAGEGQLETLRDDVRGVPGPPKPAEPAPAPEPSRDERAADFGFNFTYGADLFPARPWVLSAELDWGTLGSAELFHFRATAGVAVSHVEVYAGYEYRDIDRTQLSALIGGLRVWF